MIRETERLLPHASFIIYRRIILGKKEKDSDTALRLSYASHAATNNPDNINIDMVDFAIANRISADDFFTNIQIYGNDTASYMYEHVLPYLQFSGLTDHVTKYADNVLRVSRTVTTLDDATARLFAKAQQAIPDGGQSVTISGIPSFQLDISVGIRAINITLRCASNTVMRRDTITHECACRSVQDNFPTKLVIFHSGSYYYTGADNRLYPLSIKKLSAIRNRYGEVGAQAVTFLLFHAAEKLHAPVLRDVLRTLDKDGFCLLPVGIAECQNMHHYNELLQHRYKEADKINWNHTDVNLAYLIIKSLPYLERDCDKKRLLQVKDTSLLSRAQNKQWSSGRWQFRNVAGFLSVYAAKNIPCASEDTKEECINLLYDYMCMAHEMKCKLRLGFNSEKKILDVHDKTAKEYGSLPHKVRIPKNSRFNRLRELLPKEYEWIRSGKQLREEGIIQGHCVNSYWKDINQDECAIYSVLIDEKCYTIEFRMNKNGGYHINQIQSKYNRGCPADVKKQVQALIKQAS